MMKLINETHVTSLHVKHVITLQNQIRKKKWKLYVFMINGEAAVW